ncbi:MAG TPA: hypothetical protein VHD34_11060 [Xanthobacteraceae bacterium]|nr:hypothetical protein [Xanthobacteraceae bacterium]
MTLSLMQIAELLVFMALFLAVSMYALAASGHFPREHRGKKFKTPLGSIILFGTIVISILCAAAGVYFVQAAVPWYAAIIGGGAVVLAAPLVLQLFSDRFVDGRMSLLTFSGAAICLSCVMALLR